VSIGDLTGSRAKPSITSISIDGNQFNSLSTNVTFHTPADGHGMPMMGALVAAIDCMVDMHDNVNLSFDKLSALFNLANIATKEKIVDIKITYWTDESQTDALCTYSFEGWISRFNTSSGANHTLNLSVQPKLDEKNYIAIQMGN
jgi:hypothetical protein